MKIIFDCNYVCYVYKFALSKGMNYRGSSTEIIFGFMKNMISQLTQNDAKNALFCWDGKESLRKSMFSEYKASRHSKDQSPEEKASSALAYQQFDEIRKVVLPALGMKNIFFQEGYESDDLIASVVLNIPGEYTVVSSDEDLYQLLDHCRIHSITKKSTINKQIFQRQYGIPPSQWATVKAVAGCSSDNVKGVAGIGEKSVVDFLTGRLQKGNKYIKIKNALADEVFYNLNMSLVKLPLTGTMVPEVGKNKCSVETYLDVCEEYGFDSMASKEAIVKWEKVCRLIN